MAAGAGIRSHGPALQQQQQPAVAVVQQLQQVGPAASSSSSSVALRHQPLRSLSTLMESVGLPVVLIGQQGQLLHSAQTANGRPPVELTSPTMQQLQHSPVAASIVQPRNQQPHHGHSPTAQGSQPPLYLQRGDLLTARTIRPLRSQLELQAAQARTFAPPAQLRQQLHYRFIPESSVVSQVRHQPTASTALSNLQHPQQARLPAVKQQKLHARASMQSSTHKNKNQTCENEFIRVRGNRSYKNKSIAIAVSDFLNGKSTSDRCPKCDERLVAMKARKEHSFKVR